MQDFAALFGREPAVTADAPGRVNLIGEHTDYNGGFVLPMAIPQRTAVALAPRRDDVARVASDAVGDAVVEYRIGREERGRGWIDYVQGVTWALRNAGHVVGGFDARITSTVPVGAGLSSSAALAVAVLRALRTAFELALDDVALALLAQRAEDQFVGAHVGIMDQMAASLADDHTALFIDTREVTVQRIPFPAEAELAVIDSGVPHEHAAGGYNQRRAECEEACRLLRVTSLRDLDVADLGRIATLPEPLARRARHVVTENARVIAAVAAMRSHDLATLGRLFDESHASMRDDYEVSTPDVDRLVAITREDPRVYGARLTGGGFGGAIVALARARTAADVARRATAAYASQTGRHPTVLVPMPPARRST